MAKYRKSGLPKRAPIESSYDRGYCKPPVEHRFGPDNPGNRNGRPKGSKNKPILPGENELARIILEESSRPINNNDTNGAQSISTAQAVVRSTNFRAIKGSVSAQRLSYEMTAYATKVIGRDNSALLRELLLYKGEWETVLAERADKGTGGPEPLPHPDDIVVDILSGTVRIRGPWDKGGKAWWDKARERERDYEEDIAQLTQEIESGDNEYTSYMVEDIELSRRRLEMVRQAMDRNTLVVRA